MSGYGGGHRVRAPDKGNKPGIVLDGRTGVTIRNVVIGNFARQILLLSNPFAGIVSATDHAQAPRA